MSLYIERFYLSFIAHGACECEQSGEWRTIFYNVDCDGSGVCVCVCVFLYWTVDGL